MLNDRLRRRERLGGEPTRVWRGCLIALLIGSSTACYVYTPAAREPVQGSRLLLELNDQGRVGLGESIGPSAQVVEGTVTAETDSAYALKVVRVGYTNGGSNNWRGEPLTVSRSFVNRAMERRHSRSRTWLTVSGVTAATVLFVATRGLLGFGSGGDRPGDGDDPGQN